MKSLSIKRFIFPLVAVLCLLPATIGRAQEGEVAPWVSVRSKNFLLVGSASERQMRKVATRLEQFREAFLRLLPIRHFDASVPLRVIVFKDDASYQFFEPTYEGRPAGVSGFFQAGPDVDYITLSVDRAQSRSAEALAFHEYTHLLTRNGFGTTPLWFNEGLAEYYSTFEISDGNKKVTLGKTIAGRLQALGGGRELLPLETLLKVDNDSPYYNEPGKRSLFYAESWALVHYLLSGGRRAELSAYLDLLGQGAKVEDAFRQAFRTDFTGLESELRAYLNFKKYPQQVIAFERKLEQDAEVRSAPVSEAETQFYLGDLLMHTNRAEAAESYLEKAIALDPHLEIAHAALGVLRARQNRFEEARKHLEQVRAESADYLAHYYRAYVLSREALGTENESGAYYDAGTAALMRAELKRTIELAPNFAEGYRLLAFINLTREENLEEALALVKEAIRLSPRRQELGLLLAQIHTRRDEFDAARRVLAPLIQSGYDSQMRARAQALLEATASREEFVARVKALNDRAAEEAARSAREETPPGVLQPCDAPQPGPQLKKLRFTGEQVCGRLVRVECEDAGVTLFVEAEGRTLKLHNESLNRIRFVTYTADVRGQMTCGPREPANPALITYRPAKASAAGQVDGEVIAVEFVPREWNANH